ncbi:MAG: HDIG domain-containing protein [Caldilineae bacterium]|nr:MAG: HDIG domain-containing protein [Caldilineae bacterium]
MTDTRQPLLAAPTDQTTGGFLDRWSRDPARWRARLNLVLFCLLVALAIFLSQTIDWPESRNLRVQVGDISPIDVRAPRPLIYQSEVLTQEARERAAAAVQPIFDPPQTRVARQQIARAAQIIDFISLTRNDPYAGEEEKIAALGSISDLKIDEQTARVLLELSDERWEVVANEITRVLDRAMRQEIREGELYRAQRAVPGQIAFGLNDQEAAAVTLIVQGLLKPNAFYNAARTEEARAAAAASVTPVERTVAEGETILRSGDRIDALDIEALDVLGLLEVEHDWRSDLAAGVLALLLTLLFAAFVSQRRPGFWSQNLQVYLLAGILTFFALLAKVLLPLPSVTPYLFPLAGMSMLIGALIDLPVAVVATLMLTLLVAGHTQGNVELITFMSLGALAGALSLGRGERINSFVRAGAWITITNLAVLITFRLPLIAVTTDQDLLVLNAAGLVNGIFSSSFTLVVFYLLGQAFGLTTSLQLLELSRPTHPLLRQLLLKAPGTYHHTLLVGNMAEEAAGAIGADILLTRVGSFYHDVGKILRPYFFIENSTDGENPHDRLDPYTSARIIISHVTDGVELAHKHHLPEAIIDFIREHHGTTRVEYFYHQACQEQEGSDHVDESQFRYPGPRPRSRETAILMLADGCEATVRAMNPRTHEEMAELIRSVINRRLMSGQLDESQLTLRDLNLIGEAFERVLQGIHHPRVKYPGEVGRETPGRPEPVQPPQPLPAA